MSGPRCSKAHWVNLSKNMLKITKIYILSFLYGNRTVIIENTLCQILLSGCWFFIRQSASNYSKHSVSDFTECVLGSFENLEDILCYLVD